MDATNPRNCKMPIKLEKRPHLTTNTPANPCVVQIGFEIKQY